MALRTAREAAKSPLGDGVITALPVKRGRTDRVSVYLDGSRAFDLACVIADSAGLRVGDHLTTDEQRRLLELDAPHRARDRALRWLALRDRSSHEVADRLRVAGFDAQVVSETVAWLSGLDYLNDARFAAAYVSVKLKSGWGRRRIAAELALKGVERALIDATVDQEDTAAQESVEGFETVAASARRRFETQFAEDPKGATRRLAGYLSRRGYDWDTIHAIARLLEEKASGEGGSTSS
ncbi:MAG: regulatory protein RecX [Thermoleophilia bacterium]|nr:regulatory protein RecX [Thermoleophilia bacterium]